MGPLRLRMIPDLNPPAFYSRCLQYLLWLRSIAHGAQLLALGGLSVSTSSNLPLAPALAVVGAMGIWTARSYVHLRRGDEVTGPGFFAQLLLDVAALALFLYFTGGATNPFAPLFLLPVVIAAATLPASRTWLVAGLAAACYSGLVFFYVPLRIHDDAGHDFQFHIRGMWIGFLLAAALVSFFVSRIGLALRRHEESLARAREDALRSEQMLALGTLAAGTAHELGTPLSTIAVLAKDLEAAHPGNAEFGADLRLLRGEIDRCKSILARMARDAGQLQADAGRRLPVDQYLEGLLAEWRSAHPQCSMAARCEGTMPAPQIVADRTLSHAIVNVLDNAAEASPDSVEMDAQWNAEELHIAVRDRGPGFAPEIAGRVGKALVSGKQPEQGMGLGLFLARTTLDRLGGRIRISKAEGGGSRLVISLPLGPLLARGSA